MLYITMIMVTVTRHSILKIPPRPPVIIYGRRKTGKTFFVKNFLKPKHYFFVKRNKKIYYENKKKNLNYTSFEIILDELLERGDIIAIDEFHRLGDEFLDFLQTKSPKNLILITSTVHLFERMVGKKSPILGLFSEYEFGIIDPRDILLEFSKYIKDPKKLVEYSVFLREPITIKLFGEDFFERLMKELKITIPALIAEIFDEEDVELTQIYEGIIRTIASKKHTLTVVSKELKELNLISRADPGLIKKHVKKLRKMRIIRRVKDFFKERYFYEISSPVIDLYYYLDEKYNYSEEDLGVNYLRSEISYYVEKFFRDLLSKLFGMRPVSINLPDLEIDIALVEFQKLKVIGEVKWVKNLDRDDLEKIEENLGKFKDCRKILIIPDENILPYEPKGIEVWDVRKILELLKKGL